MADSLGVRITTTMREYLLAAVTDQILQSNVAVSDFVPKGKPWTGDQITFPVKYAKNSTFSAFAGYQVLSTSATTNRVKARFDPSFIQINSSLPFDEVVTNLSSGAEERVLDLVKTTLVSDAEDFADGFGTQFWADGTADGGIAVLGIGAAVDDGTDVPTYGGLARSTYTGMNSVITASGGTLSLAKMFGLYWNVTYGNQKPTVAYTTNSGFSLYNQLLVPQERFMVTMQDIVNGSKRGTGSNELYFEGLPIKADQKAPTGTMTMINGQYMDWYAMNVEKVGELYSGFIPSNYSPDLIEGNDYNASKLRGLGMGFTGWTRAQNALAFNGFHVAGGQLINREPRFCGQLTGFTSI